MNRARKRRLERQSAPAKEPTLWERIRAWVRKVFSR